MPKYKKRGGVGKYRIDSNSLDIVYQVINEEYLSSQKPKISQILNIINALLNQKNLPKVSYSTLQRIISKIDERYTYKKRAGRSKFLNNLKEAQHNFNAKYPLEIIQIDHTPLDIQIVDETYRKPIGRPYITVAMDIYSRMIYSFYLTLDAPSLYSVGQTIYLGLLPKDKYLEDIGVSGEWGIYGVPTTIHLDNAKEFRSKGLEQFCDVMGINIDFRPKGQPYYGVHIERVIRTLNLEIHKLKGTTFSNIQNRGDYKSENKAIFTLKELEKYITEWIVNYYHKKPHLGLEGLTPIDMFKKGLLGDEDNPPVGLRVLSTAEEKHFAKIALLPYELRTIQKTGVSIFGIKYFDEALIPFITPSTNLQKYIFKYDPKDLRKIYFYHPTLKEYIEIRAKNRFFPAITKWEIDLARKHLKDARKRNYNEEQLLETILKLRELEEQSAQKTKQYRRQKENRNTTITLSDKDKKDDKKKSLKPNALKIKKFDIDFE
jgi:putative transposase